MTKFLVIHKMLKKPMSLEEGAPLMKRIATNMTAEAYWTATWCQATADGKVT